MLPFLAGLLPAAGSLTAGGALKFAASQALPIIAWEGVSRLMHGSAEDQMREQMRIAEKLEAERGGGQPAGMAELSGLVGGGVPEESLAQLMGEDQLYEGVAQAAYDLDRARSRRPRYLDELEDILAGQHARVASLQAERVLSPLEVIQMLEGYGG